MSFSKSTLDIPSFNVTDPAFTNSFAPPSFFLSCAMDSAEIQNAVSCYVQKLLKENRLMTQENFQQNLKWPSWLEKGNFERIIGCDHVQKVIDDFAFQSIKVPRTVAVVKENELKEIEYKVNNYCRTCYGTRVPSSVLVSCENLRVFAEEIKSIDRKISKQEMEQLVKVIDKSHFSDLNPENFIISEESVYFLVDTEYKSFSQEINPEKLKRLSVFLNPEDQDWFQELISERIEKNKRIETIVEEHGDELFSFSAKQAIKAEIKKAIFTVQLDSKSY